jgi:hypothetical protein
MAMRRLSISLVFLTGCVVGGASSRIVAPVPPARAASPSRWEYYCKTAGRDYSVFNEAESNAELSAALSALGAQGWELVTETSVQPQGMGPLRYCFKRPLP